MNSGAWLCLSALTGALFFTGCGDDSTGGAGGAPEPCPAGSHAGADRPCEAELQGWTPGPDLAMARDHHVTFVGEVPGGAFLYALGGASASGFPLSTAERAPIAEDGSLGPFEPSDNLPGGLIGPGVAQVDRGLVIAGGLKADGNSTAETCEGRVVGELRGERADDLERGEGGAVEGGSLHHVEDRLGRGAAVDALLEAADREHEAGGRDQGEVIAIGGERRARGIGEVAVVGHGDDPERGIRRAPRIAASRSTVAGRRGMRQRGAAISFSARMIVPAWSTACLASRGRLNPVAL